MDRSKQAASPEEYSSLMKALAQFSDVHLLERTLRFALTPEVRSQDVAKLIAAVMENPSGRRVGWDFVRAHWTEIEKLQGGFSSESVVEATGSFCDARMRDEVKDFFTKHPAPAADRTLGLALQRANYCVDFKSQQAGQLSSWLERRGSSAGK